jgi:hypothetical protein
MKAGVSKSGSPALRLQMSLPWLRRSRALALMARVSDGCSACARAESVNGACMGGAGTSGSAPWGNPVILPHALTAPVNRGGIGTG